jgi:hypothetical protein
MTQTRLLRRLFHVHAWHVAPPIITPSGWPWPPMWACPCGETKDILSPEDWGLST